MHSVQSVCGRYTSVPKVTRMLELKAGMVKAPRYLMPSPVKICAPALNHTGSCMHSPFRSQNQIVLSLAVAITGHVHKLCRVMHMRLCSVTVHACACMCMLPLQLDQIEQVSNSGRHNKSNSSCMHGSSYPKFNACILLKDLRKQDSKSSKHGPSCMDHLDCPVPALAAT